MILDCNINNNITITTLSSTVTCSYTIDDDTGKCDSQLHITISRNHGYYA